MSYNPTARSYQFLLLQNKAYHEENLLSAKTYLDTRVRDYSAVYNPSIPSKRRYLETEKNKKIEQGNFNLLHKIQDIIYDKHKDIAGKYRLNMSITQYPKEDHSNPQQFHPFSKNDRARSLNMSVRRKEHDRINTDNIQMLNRLKNSKPLIFSNQESKSHAKQQNEYHKKLRGYDKQNRPKSVIKIYDRSKLNPVLEQFIQRQDNRRSANYDRLNMSESLAINNQNDTGITIRDLNTRANMSMSKGSKLSKKPGSANLRSRSISPFNQPIIANLMQETSEVSNSNTHQRISTPVLAQQSVTQYQTPLSRNYSDNSKRKKSEATSENEKRPAPPSGSKTKNSRNNSRLLNISTTENDKQIEPSNYLMLDELERDLEPNIKYAHGSDQNKMTFARSNASSRKQTEVQLLDKSLIDNIDKNWEAGVKQLENSYINI